MTQNEWVSYREMLGFHLFLMEEVYFRQLRRLACGHFVFLELLIKDKRYLCVV